MNWRARLYLWAADRLYDEFAWAYDLVSWVVSFGQWAGWRRQALPYLRGERVLEVGFGTGELLIAMARAGWHVTGLDLSPAMHQVTARKLRRRGVRVPRARARTQQMPFVDGSFDTIVATFPANYIVHPDTLHEVTRLLRRPRGRLVIVGLVFQADNVLLRTLSRFIYGRPTAEDPIERYRQFATAAGFAVTVLRLRLRGGTMPILILEPVPPRP